MDVNKEWLSCMNQGAQSFSEGNFSKAISFFQKAVDLVPLRPQSWTNLSSALAAHKRFTEALVAVEQAIDIDPGVMACYMIKGDVLRSLGRQAESVDAYRKAVSLHRDPHSLNRLAHAVQDMYQFQEAEQLYSEAVRMDPSFNLAKINLAGLSLILGKHEVCGALLKDVKFPLASNIERMVYSAADALCREYHRHWEPLNTLIQMGDKAPLLAELKNRPAYEFDIDEDLFHKLEQYAEGVKNTKFYIDTLSTPLPKEWDEMEALFMIPYIESPEEYESAIADLRSKQFDSVDLKETANMVLAVQAARAKDTDMLEPLIAEFHLRHWHALACNGVPGLMPGHFKYHQNQVLQHTGVRRVDPLKTVGTFRVFMQNIYNNFPHGLPRAMLILMAVCDIHPFADGNGRTALVWFNRELEWAGLMPVLFDAQLSFKGELGQAMMKVRTNPADFTPLATVIQKGQMFARQFCEQLASVIAESKMDVIKA